MIKFRMSREWKVVLPALSEYEKCLDQVRDPQIKLILMSNQIDFDVKSNMKFW